MTRLLLVRHAVAEGAAGRYWGHTDHPLNADGKEQARRLAKRLADVPLAFACASDLRRAAQTAVMSLGGRSLPVELRRELRELNFGVCEGLTYEEAVRLYPDTRAFWTAGSLDAAPPGGETLGAVVARVDGFLNWMRGWGPEGSVLVVAHGGPLRVLLCRCLGIDPRLHWQFRLDHASLTALDLQPDCALLELFNDVCHLG